MNKFALRETAVANFESALNNAGMQNSYGSEDKPKYWRGDVKDVNCDLFLSYTVDEPVNLESCDNDLFRQQFFFSGQLFTRSGYGDADFQDLAEAIETACKNANIFIKWQGEGEDKSLDTEATIYSIYFEAQQRLLK